MSQEIAHRIVDVHAVDRLSPSLLRVTVGGPGLDGFAPLGVPDEGCVFNFPEPGTGGEPVAGVGRWYTVRRYDAAAREMDVEIVLHAGGVGGEWAAAARVGDRLRITHHNSWFRRPDDAAWQLLVGDVTALPAIARICGESGHRVPTTAVVEIPDPADRRDLGVETRWIDNPTLAGAGSVLHEVVTGLSLPAGPGYVYVAGEVAATRAVRKHLRHERGMPATGYGVIGYWRVDADAWRRRQADSGVDTAELYAEAQRLGSDDEEIRDLFEERLARVGLL
jgi:NADPH-dependent ferric siderophore reductase